MVKAFILNLDPVVQKKAAKKAQHEKSNLSEVARRLFQEYVNGYKENSKWANEQKPCKDC